MKRPSKYQLIFEPPIPTLMEQLRMRFEEHKGKWGTEPKRIYVAGDIFEEYKTLVGWHRPMDQMMGFDGGVWFRGAQVLPK